VLIPFLNTNRRKPGAAIFMSGSGSNAEKLLEQQRQDSPWQPLVLVTDRPEISRARELAARFGLPLIEHDIAVFYRERGENKVTLLSESGRRIRSEWTESLRGKLAAFQVDFGILAGFVPLSNITSDFPCLNVHPGDLTYIKEGSRYLVGLHKVPLERALLDGLSYLRSSVIIAQAYTGQGGEMDSGPLLGISAPVAVDWNGYSHTDIMKIYSGRTAQRPSGGYRDLLDELADLNLERLKCQGDWVLFPPVVDEFARGNYALDDSGRLYYKNNGAWRKILTVEYGQKGEKHLIPD